MFVISVNAKNKKKLAYLFLALIFVVCLSLILCYFMSEQTQSAHIEAKDNLSRITFLQTYGWQVDEEATEIVEIAIPSVFNDVYTAYNKLQKEQNFNLEPYKGKVCRRYTYRITNYPNTDEEIRANILIYEDNIIGGDVCSLKLDGFMHGFAIKRESAQIAER